MTARSTPCSDALPPCSPPSPQKRLAKEAREQEKLKKLIEKVHIYIYMPEGSNVCPIKRVTHLHGYWTPLD